MKKEHTTAVQMLFVTTQGEHIVALANEDTLGMGQTARVRCHWFILFVHGRTRKAIPSPYP